MDLTDASMTPGGTVAGSMDGTLAFFVPAPEPSAALLAACALATLVAIRRRS
jgi:MYXO-CTERM domain-containing protein